MDFIASLPWQHPIDLINEKKIRHKYMCTLSGNIQHILDRPVQLKCGHLVCQLCLEKKFIKQGQFQCPGTDSDPKPCGVMIDRTQQMFVDAFINREVKQLVVSCKHDECKWQGEYVHYKDKHVASCEVGRSEFLLAAAESMKSLIEGLTQENKELEVKAGESQQAKSELEKAVALRDRQISDLIGENSQLKTEAVEREKQIRDLKGQIKSHEEINKLLNHESLALQNPHSDRQTISSTSNDNVKAILQLQALMKNRQIPGAPTTKSEPPRNQPSAGAVGKVQKGASSGVYTKTFYLPENLILKPTGGGVSQTFEMGGIKAKFYFGKFTSYGPVSLFFELQEAIQWPCEKTIIFTVKDISGNENNDLRREVHFPRAPERSKEKPIDKPCVPVGFREFCTSEKLAYKLNSRENYINCEGKCRVEIAVRETFEKELIGPALEIPDLETSLHWPIQHFCFDANSLDRDRHIFKSTSFLTAEKGCLVGLYLNAKSSKFPSSVTAQIKLRGNNPDYNNWPLVGHMYIRLCDYNVKKGGHFSCCIPINFDDPKLGRVCGAGKGETDEVEFFKKRLLEMPLGDDKALYHLKDFDEILVDAIFVPGEG